jgi:hypothetical protein
MIALSQRSSIYTGCCQIVNLDVKQNSAKTR